MAKKNNTITPEERERNGELLDQFIEGFLHEHGLDGLARWSDYFWDCSSPEWDTIDPGAILRREGIRRWDFSIPFDATEIFDCAAPTCHSLYADWFDCVSWCESFGRYNFPKDWQCKPLEGENIDKHPARYTWLIDEEYQQKYLTEFYELESKAGKQRKIGEHREKLRRLKRVITWKKMLWRLMLHWFKNCYTGSEDNESAQQAETQPNKNQNQGAALSPDRVAFIKGAAHNSVREIQDDFKRTFGETVSPKTVRKYRKQARDR